MINIVFGYSKNNINNQNEFLMPLYYYLCEINIKCNVIEYIENINPNDLTLHIGIFNHVLISKMPKNYIMFNIEPYENLNTDMIQKLSKAKAILYYLDYEIKDLNFLKKLRFYYPFPYHKSIENIYNILCNYNKTIDVLFYGCLNDKRISSINLLKQNNINVYCPNFVKPVYKHERDKLIFSSKIVLIQIYYINDIIDDDKQEEAMAYFKESNSDSIADALKELGEDEYTEEEVRLMHIKFMSEFGN